MQLIEEAKSKATYVDGLAASAVTRGEVATLDHEILKKTKNFEMSRYKVMIVRVEPLLLETSIAA